MSNAIALITEDGVQQLARKQIENPFRQDEALILFSSGSTAVPKGVAISKSALKNKIRSLSSHISKHEIKNTLCMVPTNFGHGLIGNSLFPLLSGAHLFLLRSLNLAVARQLRSIIDENSISFFSSVPSFWPLILSGDSGGTLASLKRIHSASAPLGAAIAIKVKQWSPDSRFFNVFGTTETLSWIGACQADKSLDETRIHEKWGVGLSVDENAELVVETADLFSYYLHQPISTAADRFMKFKTGDLARIAENGDVIVLGRLNSLINVGGFKVSPEEVERALLRNPLVKEACVFGIPDPYAGERVCAVMVLEQTPSNPQAEHTILDFLAKEISSIKIPTKIFIVNQILKSERGKLLRSELREQFLKKL